MKKLLLTAVASTAFLATPAFAQVTYEDGVAEYEINAPVNSFCKFGPGTESTGTNGSVNGNNNNGLAGSDGLFTLDIQNDADDSIQAADVTYAIPSAICNSGFTVTVDSENGGLATTGTTSDPLFADADTPVLYFATMTFDGLTVGERQSSILINPTVLANSNEARAGAASFRVRVPAQDGVYLLRGNYFDRVLVTLAPSV